MGQPLKLARILLTFLAIVNVYRAATQSITTDEAFTYNRSVSVPIPKLWEYFDANDHVLHTLLCKLSIELFGLSELTMRIPSLLGGFLFLWIALRLSRFAFGEGWLMLLSVALLGLNPFLLDYCSIARGYGMAMGMLLTAFWLLLREAWEGISQWRLLASGILLALAVAANLTALVPATALMTVFGLMFLLPPAMERHWVRFRQRANRIIDHMAVPFVVVAGAILLVPMLPAKPTSFYVGANSIAASFSSFGEAIFWRAGQPLLGAAQYNAIKPALAQWMGYAAFPVLVAGICVASVSVMVRWLRRRTKPSDSDQVLAMGGVMLILCLAAFLVMHWTLGVPYPYRRTGLILVPLVTLLSVAMFQRASGWRKAGVSLAAISLASFVLNFNVAYYDEWIVDAGNKDLMERVGRLRPKEGRKLRLATSAYVDQSARFYARVHNMDWLEIPPVSLEKIGDGDAYLLTFGDRNVVKKRGLAIRYEHPVSAVVLAEPAQSTTDSQPRRDRSQ